MKIPVELTRVGEKVTLRINGTTVAVLAHRGESWSGHLEVTVSGGQGAGNTYATVVQTGGADGKR